jgi:hypothetical protein
MGFLVQAELYRLFERVDGVVAGHQENDHVRARGLGLDQIRGEIGGAERGEIAADLAAAKRRSRLFQPCLQSMAEGIIGRDVIPFLAGVLDQRAGNGVGFHLRGVADTEDIPVAIGAGNRIGVAAGHNVEDALFIGHVGDRGRQRRVDVADEEIDLIAIDQFTRLLDRRAGVATRGFLDQELHLTAEDAAFGIDLRQRELRADQFVLPERGVSACQRIIEADLYRLVGKRLDDKWTGNLRRADGEAGLKDRPPFDRRARKILGHPILSLKATVIALRMAGHLGPNGPGVRSNECRITARNAMRERDSNADIKTPIIPSHRESRGTARGARSGVRQSAASPKRSEKAPGIHEG